MRHLWGRFIDWCVPCRAVPIEQALVGAVDCDRHVTGLVTS